MCASILLKEGKAPKADELLTQFAEKHPDCATDAHLVRAQAAAAAGNYLQAAKCLEMITSLKHKPGVVATVVALKERGGNLKGAESVLDEALEYWDSHMGEDDANSTLECIMQVRFLVYCKFIIPSSDSSFWLSTSSFNVYSMVGYISQLCYLSYRSWN